MKNWKLTSFDTFCLGMTIKGAWLFKELPSYELMNIALTKLLGYYPHLLGHYDEKYKSIIVMESDSSSIAFSMLDCSTHSSEENLYSLVPEYDIKGFKEGKVQPFSAYYVTLSDGVALIVQCAHATMDGYSFYNLVKQWAAVAKGESIVPMVVDQSLIPPSDSLSKEQTIARVKELGWCQIKFRHLFRMMVNLGAMKFIKKTVRIDISQEDLAKMRTSESAGTNATLTLYSVRQMLSKLAPKSQFTLVQVADLRGLACNIPDNFFGNFSIATKIGTFSTSTSAAEIEREVKHQLQPDMQTESTALQQCTNGYSLPYFMFDASQMNSSNPDIFYINNQLKFRPCDINFGTGVAIRAQQANLPDMIKFWQPESNGPVQIIYGGFAAKIMRKN